MSIYLNNFTPEEKEKFLDSFDLVFCDCDGVIWRNFYDEIPGSSDAIKYLHNIGKQVVFVTNNSFISTEDQLNKFSSCGLDIDEHQLIHPAKSISDYLKMASFDGQILCFSCEVFKKHLRDQGFEVVEGTDRFIENGSLSDFHKAVYSKQHIDAIIVDVDFNLTAWKLMRAQIHLKNSQCLFLAGASDPYIPFGGNQLIGPGAFIKVLEEASQCKAKVFGKPGKELGQHLLKTYDIKDPQRVLIVGDSMPSDIEFAKTCGFQTLLVLTGGTKHSDLDGILKMADKPDYVLETLADLNNLL